VPLSDRITLIEVVWTIIAVGGLATCGWALVDSLLDLLALRQGQANGAAHLAVVMNIRAGIAGTVLHVFFLVLGLAALVTLNSQQTLTGTLFAVGFILVALFNAGSIGANQLDRVRLRRYARDHPLQRRADDPSSADVPPPARTAPPG
jgi:type III secretory pathway component EscU